MANPSDTYSVKPSQPQQQQGPQLIEQPPQQAQDPNRMVGSGGTPQSGNQFNYWLAVQDYRNEIEFFKGLLEGKSQEIQPDGTVIWEYPKIWKPDTDDTAEKQRHPQGGAWYQVIEPICTPQGQRELLSWVAIRLQPGTVLSNMSAQRMLFITEMDLYDLLRMMFLNMDSWQIDPTRFQPLINTMGDRLEQARRRAVDNEERGIVGKVVSVFQSISGNQQKSGMPSVSSLYSNPGKSKF